MPQSLGALSQARPHLSTQTTGVPFWAKGSLVLVAQGMVSQSVEQPVPTWVLLVLSCQCKDRQRHGCHR